MREFLTEVNSERGVTVLLTTHDLDDIERLCSRLLVIDHGRLIYDGDLDTLKQRYGGERVLVVDLEQPMEPIAVDGARVIRVEGSRQWLAFRRDETSAAPADGRRHGARAGARTSSSTSPTSRTWSKRSTPKARPSAPCARVSRRD